MSEFDQNIRGSGRLSTSEMVALRDKEATERGRTPEALLSAETGLYTVEGAKLIVEIKMAKELGDFAWFKEAAEDALSYMDGLFYGKEARRYDLNDKGTQTELMNMFTTVEGSTDRPAYAQVYYALRDSLTTIISDVGEYPKDKEGWKKEFAKKAKRHARYALATAGARLSETDEGKVAEIAIEAMTREEGRIAIWAKHIKELTGLKEHMDARLMFDEAFIQRQQSVLLEKDMAGMLDRFGPRLREPDKGNWMSYYQYNREWGDAVDRVERVIYQIGTGERKISEIKDTEGNCVSKDVYVNGFRQTSEFTALLKVLLEASKIDGVERMDVVYNAWKQSLFKEKISKLAWKAEEILDKEGRATGKWKYVFGIPPFASVLMTSLMHGEKQRAAEFGWSAADENGNIIDWDRKELIDSRDGSRRPLSESYYTKRLSRVNKYKAVSASGHPLSIGRMGIFCDDFMVETKLKVWKYREELPYRDISLDRIWLGEEKRDPISQASEEFPWIHTDLPTGEATEAPSGSIGTWFTKRFRGYEFREKILRKIPGPSQLTIEFFQTPEMRYGNKLEKINPGQLKNGIPDNPMAWYLAGVLRARSGMSVRETGKYVEGERGYCSRDLQNITVSYLTPETAPSGTIVDSDILNNAVFSGVISEEEKSWFEENIVKSQDDLRSQAF